MWCARSGLDHRHGAPPSSRVSAATRGSVRSTCRHRRARHSGAGGSHPGSASTDAVSCSTHTAARCGRSWARAAAVCCGGRCAQPQSVGDGAVGPLGRPLHPAAPPQALCRVGGEHRLDADHPGTRVDGLDGGRDTRRQPTVAHRHQHHVGRGQVPHNLQTHRALPGDHVGCVGADQARRQLCPLWSVHEARVRRSRPWLPSGGSPPLSAAAQCLPPSGTPRFPGEADIAERHRGGQYGGVWSGRGSDPHGHPWS